MKRILALLLALLVVLSVAGCGMEMANPSETAEPQPGETASGMEEEPDNTPVTKPPFKTVYYWTQKKVSNGPVISTYNRTYDAKGNVLTDTYQISNNTAGYSYAYTYDESGRLLTETCEDRQLGSWSIEYTYNKQGKLSTKATTDQEGTKVLEYFYDESGKLVKTVQAMSSDSQIVIEFTYSRKNFLLREETFEIRAEESKKVHSVEYTYDANGNVAQIAQYDAESLLDMKRWIYDEKGKLKSEISMISGDLGKGRTYTYDKFGKILSEVTGTFQNNELQAIEAYDELRYNDRQWLESRICFDANGEITNEYEYRYDSHGNVTKETQYQYNTSKMIITEYTYMGIEVPNK